MKKLIFAFFKNLEFANLSWKPVICLYAALLLTVTSQSAFAWPFRSELNRGNDFYKKGEYSQAGQIYNKILEKKANDLRARFNLGDALYKEGRYKESQSVFESMTGASVPKELREGVYYNLGNSSFKQEDYKSAIGAYENALKIDPKDKNAQFNLALAKKMLTMPKQQNDKQQNKDQNKKQKPDDKSGKKDQDKDKEGKQNQQKQPKPGQMSKEDAMRILNALDDQEKHKTQKTKTGRGNGDVKDW